MTDCEEFIYSTFKEIKELSTKAGGTVFLVESELDGHLAIRRTLLGDFRELYKNIELASSSHIPKIETLIYDGNTTLFEEYIPGVSLDDFPVSNANFSRLMISALNILKEIHSANIIHRDIKEENFIVTAEESLFLIDFELGKLLKSPDASIHYDELPIGTIGRAAPEQFGLAPADERTDIYAFGKMCEALMEKIPDLSQKEKSLWKKIVKKSTFFSSRERFQSVSEILDLLDCPDFFYGDESERLLQFPHCPPCPCTKNDASPGIRFEHVFLPNAEIAIEEHYHATMGPMGEVHIPEYWRIKIKTKNRNGKEETNIYQNLSGFSVMGNCEAILDHDSLLTIPLPDF